MHCLTSFPLPELVVFAAVTSVPNDATRVRMPTYVCGVPPVPFAHPRPGRDAADPSGGKKRVQMPTAIVVTASGPGVRNFSIPGTPVVCA
jgi:hypothetical protein